MNWKGEILLETLSDASLLDTLTIESIEELRDEDGLWHNYHVVVKDYQIASLGSFLKDGPWFMHFENEDQTVVVFKDRYFTFLTADQEAANKAKEHGRTLDIPEEEMQFTTNER
jgi:hypothetical protein